VDEAVVTRGPVVLELSAGEAMYVLDAVNHRAARAWATYRRMLETLAGAEEREIAESTAVLLDRVARRLDGRLYLVCRWPSERDCTAPVAGHDGRGVPYCAVHLAMERRVAEQREAVGVPW
jgi:hypothetical protein